MSLLAELTPQVLAGASDDELLTIISGLESEIVQIDTDWILTPKQRIAEGLLTNLDPMKGHELLYGGAAGGGKSQWLLWHLYHQAVKYPGFSGLLLRRTFRQLVRTHIAMSFQRFDRSICRFNHVEKTWKFDNGSRIEFGFLDKEHDIYNYDSAEYSTIAFDELTQWPDDSHYLYLFSRIRTEMKLVRSGCVGHMIAATNPGRVGGAWVKKRFVDVGEPMEALDIEDDDTDAVSTRVFVPATIDDNPHYNRRQYRANLAHLDEKRRAQLELGDWDAIEGQYFHEWNRAVHVIPPFEIPAWWTRIRGIDYGYTNPMACVWIAFDGDGTAYIYRELYGTGMVPTVQARRIATMTRPDEAIAYTMADPSIWAKTGIGPCIAEQYQRAGLKVRRANNERVAGWTLLRQYLRMDETTGRPRLFIFDHCLDVIRTLPMLVHEDKNPEDLDTDGEDHAADCLAAGTAVLTDRGEMPIEEVVVGDRVLNRAGWQRVSDAWCAHSDADVRRVVTSHSTLLASPGHRFWTEERGWVCTDDLRYGDTLIGWSSIPSSSTSTTATATRSTTTRRTWRLSRLRSTSRSTIAGARSLPSTTPECSPSLPNGTPAPRGAPGTPSTPAPSGSTGNPSSDRASGAATGTTPSPTAAGSAPTPASPHGDARPGSMTSSGPARTAALPSPSTGTPARFAVPVRVLAVEPAQRAPVYDLTIDGEPEFFANGLLVHNCIRYAMMSRPKASKLPGPPVTSGDQVHWDGLRKRRHGRRDGAKIHPDLGRL